MMFLLGIPLYMGIFVFDVIIEKTYRDQMDMKLKLEDHLRHDVLTGAYNRNIISSLTDEKHLFKNTADTPIAIAIYDLDKFKLINDTYGHEAGDMVLRSVASILKKAMWGKGVAARWGGEEFLLIFEDTTMEAAAELLEEIRATVEATRIPYGEIIMSVTMSFGAASGNADMDMNHNLKQADDCLYRAKEKGRNRVMISE